eukprot:CAMPEP_0203758090 /NCGR_PEP_ID=MMETSP0098-20131031/10843_1 /ASSEMBLY_ACC=CAM_ASM_000208 /TAXON_ID=96639 /ORGANISM=" , Strain NY0313808BC1" /LENGTH=506 /DNA_ID=CAMNT_0050650341 /DNA_START=428 /DNA_END=1948 /DNA_ORIENTATION=-
MKASSLLGVLGVIEGVTNALLSPFIGSFVDLTPWRKLSLFVSVLFFTALVGVQGVLFLSTDSDKVDPDDSEKMLQEPLFKSNFVLGILIFTIVAQVVAYEIAALLTTTYVPELSSKPEKITRYVSRAYTLLNAMQLLTAAFISGFVYALGWGGLQSGSFGALFVVIVTLAWFIPGYPKLGQRTEVDPTINKSACGLVHLWETLKEIFVQYRQLFLLLVSWTFAMASLQSITVLATTYITFHLGYSATSTSMLLAAALLFSVPGSLLTSWAVKKYNLKIVYIFILVVFGMSFLIAPFLLPADTVALEDTDNSTVVTQYGNCNTQTIDAGGETKQVAPDHVLYVAIICVMIWGLGIGSVYVAYTAFYALLIPGGKEASYYGIKVTFGKVLTWLGPLLFTVINENTDKLQYTLALLGPFFLIAAVVTYFVDVDRGIADVSDTLHRRRGPAVLSVKIEEVNPMDLDNNTDNGGEPEVGLQKTISVVQENDSESNPDTAPSSATISPSTEL